MKWPRASFGSTISSCGANSKDCGKDRCPNSMAQRTLGLKGEKRDHENGQPLTSAVIAVRIRNAKGDIQDYDRWTSLSRAEASGMQSRTRRCTSRTGHYASS